MSSQLSILAISSWTTHPSWTLSCFSNLLQWKPREVRVSRGWEHCDLHAALWTYLSHWSSRHYKKYNEKVPQQENYPEDWSFLNEPSNYSISKWSNWSYTPSTYFNEEAHRRSNYCATRLGPAPTSRTNDCNYYVVRWSLLASSSSGWRY